MQLADACAACCLHPDVWLRRQTHAAARNPQELLRCYDAVWHVLIHTPASLLGGIPVVGSVPVERNGTQLVHCPAP
eukprot:6203201-Pleurochrysis_carterae.AAC.2